MKFHEFGNKENPKIMLIHGGGNSWWNFLRQAKILSGKYYVILPVLDGHGEDYDNEYVSSEKSAEKLINYIDENCGGDIFLLYGVSLGGQIVIEMLSQRKKLAKKAIIDGSICYPQPILEKICETIVLLFKWFMFSKYSCIFQMKVLKLFPKIKFTKELEEYYIEDMPKIRTKTLLNMYRTYMNGYTLKDEISFTLSEIYYWYGSKEMKCVKKSAEIVKSKVKKCTIHEFKNYNHGYLAIYKTNEWVSEVEKVIENKK